MKPLTLAAYSGRWARFYEQEAEFISTIDRRAARWEHSQRVEAK